MSWPRARGLEAAVVALLVAAQVALAWPALDYGVLADNDFAGHAATAMVLHHEQLPEAGSLTGWNPRFNLGAPFLLYNPPPLLYAATVGLARPTGLDIVLALKLLLIGAFAAVPATTWWLARECEDERTAFPALASAATVAVSSELWGLEFFFRNGMANAAFVLPLGIATLAAYRRSLRAGTGGAWALGAGLFALVVLTHLTTAYMVALGLAALAVAHPRPGAAVLAALGLAATGVVLTAPWLIPSVAVAAPEPVAFTWIRDPGGILAGIARGTWFTSYEAGFYPRFRSTSAVGAAVLVLGVSGAAAAIRERDRTVLGLAGFAALTTWIALGPRAAGPLLALPLYDDLLWYRFTTVAVLGWLLLAGYGASRLIGPDARFAARTTAAVLVLWGAWNTSEHGWVLLPLVAGAVAIAMIERHRRVLAGVALVTVGVAATSVLVPRARRIETAADYGRETIEIGALAEWLVANGDRRRRLFSEFPFQVSNAVSVNYTRHLLPLETGFDEVAGWIYEHNPASQGLQARGPFWYDPFPMIRDARTYDVGYVVARSDRFRDALDRDPRWHRVVGTPRYGLYASLDAAPSRVDGPASTSGYREGHLPGGGYGIRFVAAAAGPHVVKTNASPFWAAEAGGAPIEVGATDLGLITVEVPAPDAEVRLVWTPPRPRAGWLGTALGLVVLAFAAAARLDALRGRGADVAGGLAFAAVALLSIGTATDRRVEAYAFGLRDGLAATADPARIEVGSWDDGLGPNHLLGGWSPPLLLEGAPARVALPDAPATARLVASPLGATVHVEGRPLGDGDATLEIFGPEGAIVASGPVGEPLVVPPLTPGDDGPGVSLTLVIRAAAPWVVHAVHVASDVRYVEGEHLRNVVRDGGGDAFLGPGPDGVLGHGGALAMLPAPKDAATRLTRDHAVPEGDWDVWIRSAPAYAPRGEPRLDVLVGDRALGSVRPPGEGLGWAHAGRVAVEEPSTLTLSATSDVADWINVDLVALVRR